MGRAAAEEHPRRRSAHGIELPAPLLLRAGIGGARELHLHDVGAQRHEALDAGHDETGECGGVTRVVLALEPVDDRLEDERQAGCVAPFDGAGDDLELRRRRGVVIGPEGQEQLAGIGAGGQRRIRAPVRQKRGDAAALGVGIPLRLERHHDGGRPARAAGEHGGTVLRIDQDARRGGRQRGHDLGLERGDVGSLRRCHAAALEGDPKRVAVVAGDQREHAARADPVEAAAPTEVGGSRHSPRSAR